MYLKTHLRMTDKEILSLTMKEVGQIIHLHSEKNNNDIKLLAAYITSGNHAIAKGKDGAVEKFLNDLTKGKEEAIEVSDEEVLEHLRGRMSG